MSPNFYEVTKLKEIDNNRIYDITVPGSKSMTNRALLLAALSKDICKLEGALFSDDSRNFLKSLIDLGFDVFINENEREVIVKGENGNIPNKKATIYVGSAGTAARFLTAMLSFTEGDYIVNSSEQMKKRPMKPLIDVLRQMGANIECLEEEDCFPLHIRGIKTTKVEEVELDISKSTQFLSALLMTMSMLDKAPRVVITSDKKTGSYIKITEKMMSQFGVFSEFDGLSYSVKKDSDFKIDRYIIEPDLSAAAYFYAAAMMNGFKVVVKDVHPDTMQGDYKFLELLCQMGATAYDSKVGIVFEGCKNGIYDGISVDMNDFSDQALTLSVVAAYAQTPTHIKNIGHIRAQESDRIKAIVNELSKVGVRVDEEEDGVIIYPLEASKSGKMAEDKENCAVSVANKESIIEIETYDDHRVAMSFALLGLKREGIRILNPACTGKTFENYFEVLAKLYEKNIQK